MPLKSKPARIALRVAAGLVVIGVLAVICCVEGVDYRPYFRQGYYTETTTRLRAQSATNQITFGQFYAGFGRAKLTPKINAAQDDSAQGEFRGLPLAGYGDRKGKPATGVHDDLYVKAAAFKVNDRIVVMIGADALIIPPEVTAMAASALQKEPGLTREQIYLSATHTHCGIGGWGQGVVAEQFAGGFHPAARAWFADRIIAAVRQAVADLKPAAFGQGHFAAPEFIRNRLVGSAGNVDPDFNYAVLKQAGGTTAVLGTYGAHATVLSGRTMEFSADYPGYWQRTVEEATGGIAIFLAGAVGSHGPVPGGDGFKGAEHMGKALAQGVVERLPQTPLTNAIAFGLLGLNVTMPPFNARVSDGTRLRPWLAARLLPSSNGSFIQAVRLNDTIWISTPCDFSGELALGLKDFLRVRGSSAVITSFNGDYVGYVIPSRYYHLNGYEPRIMSFFGPNVPDYFDELIRTMSLKLAEK